MSDTINGTSGNDSIVADPANDTIYSGADLFELLAGNDVIFLTEDNAADTVNGGDGADFLLYAGSGDRLYGQNGSDTLYTERLGTGRSTLDGGNNNDTLYGDDGFIVTNIVDDILNGGNGDDYIFMSEGDIAIGGDGADRFLPFSNTSSTQSVQQMVIFDFEDGVDEIGGSMQFSNTTQSFATFEADGILYDGLLLERTLPNNDVLNVFLVGQLTTLGADDFV